MGKLNKDNLFKPNLSRAENKSRTTDEIARAITDDEIAQRNRKTERLRAIRLAKEAEERENGTDAAPKKKRAAPAKRIKPSMAARTRKA